MYAKASPAIPCRCVHEVRPAQGRSQAPTPCPPGAVLHRKQYRLQRRGLPSAQGLRQLLDGPAEHQFLHDRCSDAVVHKTQRPHIPRRGRQKCQHFSCQQVGQCAAERSQQRPCFAFCSMACPPCRAVLSAYLIISGGFYASILRWDEAIFAQVIDFSLWILV